MILTENVSGNEIRLVLVSVMMLMKMIIVPQLFNEKILLLYRSWCNYIVSHLLIYL